MSIGLEYLENEKNKLKEELEKIDEKLNGLDGEDYQNLLKQRKKTFRALSLMSDMIDVRKMEECHHIYVMIKEEEDSISQNEYPYCIKCNLDTSVALSGKINSVKDSKMRHICTCNDPCITMIPKGDYLKNSRGYIYCSKEQIKEIYQDIIDQNKDIDDTNLKMQFMEKLDQKNRTSNVKKKK